MNVAPTQCVIPSEAVGQVEESMEKPDAR